MSWHAVREALTAGRQFLMAAIGWIMVMPLRLVIRRNEKLLVIPGREGFSDNSKYLFVEATRCARHDPEFRAVFLTRSDAVASDLRAAGGDVEVHPSWKSMILLLRCGLVASDVSSWFDYAAFPLTSGATRVQMWHGAPLKHIELAQLQRRLERLPRWAGLLLMIHKGVIGRYPTYDGVVATSKQMVDAAFSWSFRSREFLALGYPRNDALFVEGRKDDGSDDLLAVNVDAGGLQRVEEARQRRWMVCLYVPTFRKDMGNPFSGVLDLESISRFAVANDVFFVVKLHPFLSGVEAVDDYPNLMEYSAAADVYPLMPWVDVLVTDYSSIAFDFLLLDRPVAYLVFDFEEYVAGDRAMYFDFEVMSPGMKAADQEGLEQNLSAIMHAGGDDGFGEDRERVRRIVHDWRDGKAGERLLRHYFPGCVPADE